MGQPFMGLFTGKGEKVGAKGLNVRAHRGPGDRVGRVNPIRSKSK